MIRLPTSSLPVMLAVVSVTSSGHARAEAPSACKFLSITAVSAALGKPITAGGTISTVDHAGATASSCMYMATPSAVVLIVDERGTAAAAMQEFKSELNASQAKDNGTKGSSSEQKTVLETGIGEGAFSDNLTNGSMQEFTAVHGSRLYKVGIMGAGSLPHDRIRSLMQVAVSH
jgi:hypothetical protein